jgi:hypothetical protein
MHTSKQRAIYSVLIAMGVLALACVSFALASSTSNFQQTIGVGGLAVDIVDNATTTVSSPAVSMGAATFSFECNTSTGTFGTSDQRIYIQNPDASDSGWTVALAAPNATSVWDSAGTDMDFNEAGAGGCVDDGGTTDSDALAGQLSVDPTTATISSGPSGASTASIDLGSASQFVEGTTNSITLVTGQSGSADIGDWGVLGISVTQTIPPEQPAASDYDINMVLTISAI